MGRLARETRVGDGRSILKINFKFFPNILGFCLNEGSKGNLEVFLNRCFLGSEGDLPSAILKRGQTSTTSYRMIF